MQKQRKFPASSLFTAALVAAVMLGGAVSSAAQTEQESIPSKPPAPIFKTLVNFDGTNGSGPSRPPIQGPDGNLYGTTPGGGANGQGELFKMTPAGDLTPLYSFCSETGCTDGTDPGGLGLGMDGNFYGEAGFGGTFGLGTIFKFTGSGAPITLHSFDGSDGRVPGDRMVQIGDGNFYGTTFFGGNLGECLGIGCGTVFEMTPQRSADHAPRLLQPA